MKIVHVISGLHKAAGTSVFVGELASRQADMGHDVTILLKVRCDNEYPVSEKVRVVSDISQTPCECSSGQASRISIVHVHALWDFWLTRMAQRCRKLGAKVVWSPHGMLTPWALKNKLPKKVIGLLAYQYWMLRGADLLHATADSELADIRRLWLANPVVVAPLGVCLPPREVSDPPAGSMRYLCFVSRVQKKKGLANLIRAWSLLPEEVKRGWQVKIAGPDEDDHLQELCSLCEALSVGYARPFQGAARNGQALPVPEIQFLGPVYGDAKDELFARAAFSVLPTHSENFGSVVIESLAQGTPVVCTRGAPWAELEGDGCANGKCGWWIDIGVEPLAKALTEAMTMSGDELRRLGRNGRALVERKYTWESVAAKMEDAYAGIA